MRNNRYKIASLVIFFAAALCGCMKNGVEEGPVVVSLSLRTDCADVMTKATENGLDSLNENVIKDIHWYFFDGDTYLLDGTQSSSGTGSSSMTLSGIDATAFNKLFPASPARDSVNVYVVVNAGSASLPSKDTTTVAKIKNAALSLTSNGKQTSFVMFGEGALYNNSTGSLMKAAGDIDLKRVASKIKLKFKVSKTFHDSTGSGTDWKPEISNISVSFKNLEKNGKVGGEDANSATLADVSIAASSMIVTEGTDDYTLEPASPIYSYPREWEISDTDIPVAYITLPWTCYSGGSSETKPTYYKFLFPTDSLESNFLYNITVKLEGLGSLVPEEKVTLPNLSLTLDDVWRDALPEPTENNTDADMYQPHVLAISSNVYTIYNQESIEIPFITSHNCIIEKVTSSTIISSLKVPGNQDSGTNKTISIKTTEPGASDDNYIYVNNEDDIIEFKHTLKNMPSSGTDYDYKEYVQTYKLSHISDATVFEYVTIRQRPSICIEYEATPSNGEGYIFDHGAELTSSGNEDHSYRILKTSSSVTADGIQRVITGVLPTEGTLVNFKIGDPRDRSNPVTDFSTLQKEAIIQNGNNASSAKFYRGLGYDSSTSPSADATFKFEEVSGSPGKYIDGSTKHNVSIYYPTRSDAEAENIIAPEFIICSGYPGVNSHYMNRAAATLRCAAYQEIGYPAGRWRLPTKAEMTYVARLQNDGHIKKIFNDTSGYVAANDHYMVKGTSLNQSWGSYTFMANYASVRCVYDSWYWDQIDKENGWDTTRSSRMTTFTYGDMAIE